MLMYGGNGVQLLPRFQDNKFQALLNEHQNTIEDPIQEKTEMPGKIHPFNIYILTYLIMLCSNRDYYSVPIKNFMLN